MKLLGTATAPNFSSVVAMRRFGGASASSQMYETVAFRQPFGQALVPTLLFIIFVQFLLSTKIIKILTISCLMIFVLIFLLLLHHY